MFELSDFFQYCRANDVDVIPFDHCPAAGSTVREDGCYAVFLDFTKIKSTRLLRGICCHEMAHVATGALHKVDSPYELAERSEYRANRWMAQRYLTEDVLREAFAAGYRELWQLEEYFDLPQGDIQAALDYWTVCRGVDFAKQET